MNQLFQKWTRFIALLILATLSFSTINNLSINYLPIKAQAESLSIALVGPLSGPSASVGREMERSVRLYLEQFNAMGGVNGQTVELSVYDDQNDPALAVERAQEIIDANQALVVIGHNTSATSAAAGPLYAEAGIPAISGSATADRVTADNPWYFRTIFNNSAQASFLAGYSRRVLLHDDASIVFTDDAYGQTLADSFQQNFEILGGEINHIVAAPNEEHGDERMLPVIEKLTSKSDGPGVVILALSQGDAHDFLVALRALQVNFPMMGADSMGSVAFAESFAGLSAATAEPGIFTNGIHVVVPLLYDSANAAAQALRNGYQNSYDVEPGWRAATFYDATLVATRAIELAIARDNVDAAALRTQIRDEILAFDRVENALDGATGPIYFDEDGSARLAVGIGLFQNQQLISAPTQLRTVVDPERLQDGDSEDTGDRSFRINDQDLAAVKVVYAGIELVRVRDLDNATSSYLADFFLWFRHQNATDVENIEFINAAEPIELGEPLEEAVINGMNYTLYRVVGRFREQLDFKRYPFDTQDLTIRFRNKTQTRDRLLYAVDEGGMRFTDSDRAIERMKAQGVFSDLNNWTISAIRFFQDVAATESPLGNPRYFNSEQNVEFSRFNVDILIERRSWTFIIKNMLPAILILIIMYIVFYVPPDQLNPRLTVSVSTLLTNAFFLLSLSNNLPEVGYAVAIEYAFYFAFILSIYVITISLLEHLADRDGNMERLRLLKRLGRIGYPVILFTFIMIFGLYYVRT